MKGYEEDKLNEMKTLIDDFLVLSNIRRQVNRVLSADIKSSLEEGIRIYFNLYFNGDSVDLAFTVSDVAGKYENGDGLFTLGLDEELTDEQEDEYWADIADYVITQLQEKGISNNAVRFDDDYKIRGTVNESLINEILDDDGATGNMACDNGGPLACSGTSCPQWFQCKGQP